MSLHYTMLLSCWFINLAVGSCENITLGTVWYLSTVVCVSRLNKCYEILCGEVSTVTILLLAFTCYPEHHSHVRVHTDSCEAAFLDLILEPGEETHALSLSVSDISPHKISFKFSLHFLLKKKAGGVLFK